MGSFEKDVTAKRAFFGPPSAHVTVGHQYPKNSSPCHRANSDKLFYDFLTFIFLLFFYFLFDFFLLFDFGARPGGAGALERC